MPYRYSLLSLASLLTVASGCAPRNQTLRTLEAALDQAYGNRALTVGYHSDSTRLLIMLPGDSTALIADTVFDSLSQALGVIAVRAHPDASVLRAITVITRQEVGPGQYRILQTREISPPAL